MKTVRNRIGVFVLIFILCFGGVALSSCAPATSTAAGSGASSSATDSSRDKVKAETWAVYWYMCGSNLESNNQCATDDLEELFKVALPDNVQIIILAGGAKKWHNGFDPDVLQVATYTSKGFEVIDTWPVANMGASSTLETFLNYCNKNYPADNRVLHFWDHGGGSLSGVCNDEKYNMDSLSLLEISKALAATSKTADGSPLYEMVTFDACLMATIDTAAVVAPYARYMVASEEIEPLDGWDYTGVYKVIASNPSIKGEGFGRGMCDAYYAYYKAGDARDLAVVTMSLIDLTKLGTLLTSYKQLGDEALIAASKDKEYMGAYGRAAKDADNYSNSPSSGYTNMMDLGDFVAIGVKAGLFPSYGAAVTKALNECVLYKVNGTMHPRATGLSCFYNYQGNAQKLQIFLDIGTSKGFSYFYEYVQKGSLSTEATEYVKQASNALLGQTVTPPTIDTNIIKGLDDYPLVLGDNGQWELNIGPELGKQLAAVYMTQAWMSNPSDVVDGFLGLYGMTGYFPHDFNKGIFTANFQNDWFALGELPLYTEPLGADQNFNLYASPVQINGVRYVLNIKQDTKTGNLELLGATLPIDPETGMAGKEIYQLKNGDKVEAIMYVLLPPGKIDAITGTRLFDMPLGEITYDSSAKMRMRSVSNTAPGEWTSFAVSFAMIDYAGNVYFSDYGYYQVSDGKIQAYPRLPG